MVRVMAVLWAGSKANCHFERILMRRTRAWQNTNIPSKLHSHKWTTTGMTNKKWSRKLWQMERCSAVDEVLAKNSMIWLSDYAKWKTRPHYTDVIMGSIASQITSLTIVYSTVYSDADKRKHQSSASLAFVRGIHRGPVNSPHKWPVTRKMFPFWWRPSWV